VHYPLYARVDICSIVLVGSFWVNKYLESPEGNRDVILKGRLLFCERQENGIS
jgi:hypothetical protein